MEIISYYGSSSRSRSFNRPRSLLLKYKAKRRKLYDYARPEEKSIAAKLYAGKIRALRVNLSKVSLLQTGVFICILTAVVFTAVTFNKAISYFQSYSGPVQLAENYETEMEILKSAMSKFAMDRIDENVDEAGNVLSDDGKILTASSVGIAKTISYTSYQVKKGDTISSIALKFGLTNISTLIAVNGIDNVRALRSGQKLRIPNQDGLNHTVAKGDSLNILSLKYHVSVEEILDANDLTSKTLAVGQELFIPGAKMDSSSLKKAMGELFICPLKAAYRLSSYFGRRADPFSGVTSNHTGIDMACPTGTPIFAAQSGTAVKVGTNSIYGNYVIINHGNGYQSLYAHMSKILCHNGQTVSQGTRIGLVGSTGYSTGPHLHLSIYKYGKLVDPLTLIKR